MTATVATQNESQVSDATLMVVAVDLLRGCEVIITAQSEDFLVGHTFDLTIGEIMPQWRNMIEILKLLRPEPTGFGDWSVNVFCTDGLLSFPS